MSETARAGFPKENPQQLLGASLQHVPAAVVVVPRLPKDCRIEVQIAALSDGELEFVDGSHIAITYRASRVKGKALFAALSFSRSPGSLSPDAIVESLCACAGIVVRDARMDIDHIRSMRIFYTPDAGFCAGMSLPTTFNATSLVFVPVNSILNSACVCAVVFASV